MTYALVCTDISNKEIIYFKTFPDLPTAKFHMMRQLDQFSMPDESPDIDERKHLDDLYASYWDDDTTELSWEIVDIETGCDRLTDKILDVWRQGYNRLRFEKRELERHVEILKLKLEEK